MNNTKVISGISEEQIWDQIEVQLQSDPDLLQYQAEIHHSDKIIYLDVDIDLGGGFEGGFELTTISSPSINEDVFRFALHHEEFVDEVGKFFGMQDQEIGYPEFDQKVVVKSNDLEKVKSIFSDVTVRTVIQSIDVFRLYIEEDGDKRNLVLQIEEAITDHVRLREIYSAFYKILKLI